MADEEIQFASDTATLCVFDLLALRHRLNDDADWWSIAEEELTEVNKGNAAFIGLGDDGVYVVEIGDGGETSEIAPAVEIRLKFPSGRVFIGAAEEVTSDGLEPEGIRGRLVSFQPGNYRITLARVEARRLRVQIIEDAVPAINDFREIARI
ncbi:MAG TPA: DUF6386 family protein [Tepidisphaeraceae bacterium]|jgi:hypothetical protein|nr:DUF6386 family protein [Tepidisphaeraceae bacterium]